MPLNHLGLNRVIGAQAPAELTEPRQANHSTDLFEKIVANGFALAWVLGGSAIAVSGIKSGEVDTAIYASISGSAAIAVGGLVGWVENKFNR